jgi:hypothetical protein
MVSIQSLWTTLEKSRWNAVAAGRIQMARSVATAIRNLLIDIAPLALDHRFHETDHIQRSSFRDGA